MMKECPVKFLKTHPDAITPKRSYGTSAAFDVFSCETFTIQPGESVFVDIGGRFQIPEGFYVKFASRSGMGLKKDVFVFPGLLDAGYADECSVKLYNCGKVPYTVECGKAVAQVIVGQMVDNAETMTETNQAAFDVYTLNSKRGKNGHGSTGM